MIYKATLLFKNEMLQIFQKILAAIKPLVLRILIHGSIGSRN